MTNREARGGLTLFKMVNMKWFVDLIATKTESTKTTKTTTTTRLRKKTMTK